MKKFLYLILLATLVALVPTGCRKDSAGDDPVQTTTADFDLRIADIRGKKVFNWQYSAGSFHTDDQKGQTLDVTSDKRIVLYVSSTDPAFTGVRFETSANLEVRKMTREELTDYWKMGHPATYPEESQKTTIHTWQEGDQAWDICYKEGADGPGTVSVIAGDKKKSFSVNVVKEIPLDYLVIRVTSNFGYDQTVNLKSVPEEIGLIDVSNDDDPGKWKYYFTDEGTELLRPYFLFEQPYCYNSNKQSWFREIITFEPENTTYRTLKSIRFGYTKNEYIKYFPDSKTHLPNNPLISKQEVGNDVCELFGYGIYTYGQCVNGGYHPERGSLPEAQKRVDENEQTYAWYHSYAVLNERLIFSNQKNSSQYFCFICKSPSRVYRD